MSDFNISGSPDVQYNLAGLSEFTSILGSRVAVLDDIEAYHDYLLSRRKIHLVSFDLRRLHVLLPSLEDDADVYSLLRSAASRRFAEKSAVMSRDLTQITSAELVSVADVERVLQFDAVQRYYSGYTTLYGDVVAHLVYRADIRFEVIFVCMLFLTRGNEQPQKEPFELAEKTLVAPSMQLLFLNCVCTPSQPFAKERDRRKFDPHQ